MYDYIYNNLGQLESVRRTSDGATVWVRGNNPAYTNANPITAVFLLTNPDLSDKPERAFSITLGSGTASGGGGVIIPVGSNPTVVRANETSSNGLTLTGSNGATISFASIANPSALAVEMQLQLAGAIVAVATLSVEYFNPLRAFSYSAGGQTYSGVFVNGTHILA